jgi:hypothetical protein
MSVERDAFRTTLRVARLCLELDCNTIFDSARYRECPTCGSAEAYPLETWLNRYRLHALPHRPVTGFARTTETVYRVVGRAVQAVEDARRVAVGQVYAEWAW